MTKSEKPLSTKPVFIAIKETRNLEVAVPTDVTPEELRDFGQALHYAGVREYDCMDLGEIEVVVADVPGVQPQIRATRKENKLQLVSHPHTAEPLLNRGLTHSDLVDHFDGKDVLRFTPVVVEFPDGDISHGVIYFRDRYSVVAAFFAEYFKFGTLPLVGHHYPVDRATRLFPWTMVIPCSIHGYCSIERLVEAIEDGDEKSFTDYEVEPIDHASLAPNLELVRVEPRMAENPRELIYQHYGCNG